MHELYCIEEVADDKGCSFFRKGGPIGDDIKELAI